MVVAGDHHDEAGTGGKRGVVDIECPARGRAEALGIVGQGILRFGDAYGQFSEAPFGELLKLCFGLVAEIHVARAVNLLGDTLNFFRERFVWRVEGMDGGTQIFLDGCYDFFGKFFCAGATFFESFRESAGDSVLRAVSGEAV